MNLNGKKLFLIGFVAILLVGIPVSVYLLQQQQEVRSRAEKSTILSFVPESSATSPISKSVGDSIPLDVMVNPGTNLVSYVKLEIQYDPDKLATASSNAFQANTAAFPSVLEGPIYTPGKVAVSLSVGPDPTKSIQQLTKAATFTFVAKANTPAGTPTLITYGSGAQVLSIASTDQASEDVLSSTVPATIVIGASTPSQAIPSGSPEPTAELQPTDEVMPSEVPTPTTAPTATTAPTPTTAPTATTIPTGGPGGPGAVNQPPVCNSLVADRSTTGTAPFSVTLTANGTDTDGTISKVTFNFGDGQVSDVTTGNGIGTRTVNIPSAHTYNNTGTYQASAIITDNSNGISTTGSCQIAITVASPTSAPIAGGGGGDGGDGGDGGNAAQPTAVVATATPGPTMAPTGAATTAIGIGIGVMLLMMAGGFLLFML